MVGGDDGVGVVAGIAVDVGNRLVHVGHQLDADDRRQVFLVPVLFGGWRDLRAVAQRRAQQGGRFRVTAHLHALGGQQRTDLGQELRRHGARHQQAFGGVAGAVLLRLGVVDHAQRHRQVAGRVNEHMAVAVQVLDHRHPGLAADALDQALAAARDDDVDKLGHRDQLADGGAVGGLHQLHRVFGQAGLGQRLAHQCRQRTVGMDGLGAAAQYAGVAALDRQAGGLDGDVGAALVNHAEHAQRHAHLAHAYAAGLLLHADDFANDVGHGRQLFAALGDRGQHLVAELEPVHHGCGQASRFGGCNIACVLGLQCRQVRAKQRGQRPKCFVFSS